MNILYILGSIGGTIYLIKALIAFVKDIGEFACTYKKYERFYTKHKSAIEGKMPMGFKTREEEDQIKAKFTNRGS